MKKSKDAPVDSPPDVPPLPVKKADLDAEFEGLVNKALADIHVLRATAVMLKHPTHEVVFRPVVATEIDRASMLARDVAMKERSACLDIVKRVLADRELSSKVSAAVTAERGEIAFPMTMKMTWDDQKGWMNTTSTEYKLGV